MSLSEQGVLHTNTQQHNHPNNSYAPQPPTSISLTYTHYHHPHHSLLSSPDTITSHLPAASLQFGVTPVAPPMCGVCTVLLCTYAVVLTVCSFVVYSRAHMHARNIYIYIQGIQSYEGIRMSGYV